VRFAFDTLDYEKTGLVTQKQIKVALRAMGFPVKKADIFELLRKHGEEENEKLGFDAFRRAVADKLVERSPQDDMRRAFQLFDVHGAGRLDLASLRKVVKSLGLDIADGELQDMIHEFDADGDGMISESEFMAVMMAGGDDV